MDPKCLTTLGTFSPSTPETSRKAAPHRRVFSQGHAWLVCPPQSRHLTSHLPHTVCCPFVPEILQPVRGHHCWADTMERHS